jgi:4-amino-4-deoxy-L-arabinose transferase-like glycosyltransferase
VILGCILILGFAIRLYGNNFGLPMRLHPDEPFLVDSAYRMVQTGDLNPHWFYYPSLLMYIYAFAFKIEALFSNFGMLNLDTSVLYITARSINALMGTLMLIVTYYIGCNLYDKRTGIIAASFLMAMPLAVMHSHYATTDIPLTFFIVLSVLFASLILKNGTQVYYILTGICIGLAISTKYTAGLLVIMLLVSHFYVVRKSHASCNIYAFMKIYFINKTLMLSIFSICLAFLLTTPYAILDFDTFRTYFTNLIIYSEGTHGVLFLGTMPSWIYHLVVSLPNGMTLILEVLSIIGILFTLRCMVLIFLKPNEPKLKQINMWSAILLLSWVLPYYLIMGSWGVKFDRYVIPLLPFLSLFGAYLLSMAIDSVSVTREVFAKRQLRGRVIRDSMAILAVLLLLIAPLQASVELDKEMLKEDTREQALAWLAHNLPKNSYVVRERYTPEAELLPNIRCKNYDGSITSHDLDEFRDNHVDYIIISSRMYGRYYAHRDASPSHVKFYDSLDKQCKLVKTFKSSKKHPGPKIKIYKLGEAIA